jgi:hypothetical protein
LINSHNDIVALSLALIGVYLIFKKKKIWSRLFLLLSGGIKYLTLPLVFVSKDKKKVDIIIALAIIAVIVYLSIFEVIQPWYFLSLFALMPFFNSIIEDWSLFSAGLLFSYYSYLRYGHWGLVNGVNLKYQTIIVFLIVNLCLICFRLFKRRFKTAS